jgi:hypothetical protein
MNEHALAHLKTRLRKERIVRRDESFRDGRRFSPIEIGRDFDQVALRHKQIIGLRAASREAEDALPRAKRANLASNFCDLAREFEAGDVLRDSLGSRVQASSLQKVCAVQSGGTHADEDAVGRSLGGAFDRAHFQPFDAAVSGNDYRAHFLRTPRVWNKS